MRIISLDLGSKTCGFAITDFNQTIANPLENFTYSKNDIQQVINRLNYWYEYYQKEFDTILIGYPTNTMGNTTNMTLYVENFVNKLKNTKFSALNIILYDERYSTKYGSELLMELGFKNSFRKKHKDMLAAYIILDDYIKGK